jgi:hypothetical protein
MNKIVRMEVEEFEIGAWVADIVSLDQFDGSFELAGETWTGTMVSERTEAQHYHTRVVGGAGKLGTVIPDKYYDGSVSVQAAVQDVCREAGETFGAAKAGVFLTTFERLRGPAYAALDAICAAFSLVWWIGRDGTLQMQATRPDGAEAEGLRVESGSDSALLRAPEGLTPGVTYDGKTVRHVRWTYSATLLEARAYFLPFVFRVPTDNRYDAHVDAKVDQDNGDGTINVIVAGRYGLTKVKLFCGVPRSKVKVEPGDLVTVGYFGGDPQKPYAVAMAQYTSATKEVARKGDTVKVTMTAANISSLAGLLTSSPSGGPLTATPPGVATLELTTGEITSGSQRLKVGD